mmetsp:Transcript_30563/g.85618  ORF Transcript_30563/g.85618 Transcript_30563/m.85618 type:complete len:299 (-) Transcript_30563:1347-2243(-)
MRDAEGLVQVQVAHVRPDLAGGGQAHLGVHVGSVHVHLATVLVDDVADLVDVVLVHPMGRGVGDHQRRQVVRVLLCLLDDGLHIHVAVRVGANGDNLHAGHDGGRGVGPVGRGGDDADVPLVVAVGLVVRPDGHQARILPAGPRVGLQRAVVEPGDVHEHVRQLGEHLLVALHLVHRGVRVDVGELGPGDGDHLRRGVQLHGARAKGDHGVHQGEVLLLKAGQVAQHLVLGVVAVEDGGRQEVRLAGEGPDAALHGGGQALRTEPGVAACEHGEQVVQVRDLGDLVEGDAHVRVVKLA